LFGCSGFGIFTAHPCRTELFLFVHHYHPTTAAAATITHTNTIINNDIPSRRRRHFSLHFTALFVSVALARIAPHTHHRPLFALLACFVVVFFFFFFFCPAITANLIRHSSHPFSSHLPSSFIYLCLCAIFVILPLCDFIARAHQTTCCESSYALPPTSLLSHIDRLIHREPDYDPTNRHLDYRSVIALTSVPLICLNSKPPPEAEQTTID
jgi:hypothetical protein